MSLVVGNHRLGTAHIIQGNALNLPLPDNSVDLVCTSPPYFGLRSYQDGGAHYDGQIGSEATPAEFLDALLAATREMVRVLKPSGSIFVNLGDKYAGSRMDGSSGNGKDGSTLNCLKPGYVPPYHENIDQATRARSSAGGIPTKSLMGIPWRYAIACIDQLGLILRAEIIWAKPNGLPESVTDRVRRSHEQWFHLTKSPRYFSAVDEIREEHTDPSDINRPRAGKVQQDRSRYTQGGGGNAGNSSGGNPLGKLPGSVWTIATQPLTVPPELGVDHFAAYPMEWPRRIIQGWTPNGICTECGEGRRPATDKKPMEWRPSPNLNGRNAPGTHRQTASGTMLAAAETTITGYVCACTSRNGCMECHDFHRGIPTYKHDLELGCAPDCPCQHDHASAPTTPAVVLDPFGGTGTTALVAKALGRIGITVDLSRDYCRLAEWRCNDPRELAAALEVEKPELIPDGQLSLFDGA